MRPRHPGRAGGRARIHRSAPARPVCPACPTGARPRTVRHVAAHKRRALVALDMCSDHKALFAALAGSAARRPRLDAGRAAGQQRRGRARLHARQRAEQAARQRIGGVARVLPPAARARPAHTPLTPPAPGAVPGPALHALQARRASPALGPVRHMVRSCAPLCDTGPRRPRTPRLATHTSPPEAIQSYPSPCSTHVPT